MKNKQSVKIGLLMTASLFFVLSFTSCVGLVDYEKEQEEDIASFLEKSEYDYVKKESGLYYYDYKLGVGISPSPGDSVFIHYSSFLLSNILLSRHFDGEPLGYVLGSGALLDGVNEAISYMKPGGFSYAIIPSYLGYGNYSSYYPNPYTPILMYIELVRVKYKQ